MVKPAAERLYGRTKGNTLRPRQRLLLDTVLPRLRLDPAHANNPAAAFPVPPQELWLEIGFGGGEHARFVHPDLRAPVARALRPGGEWRIASDDPIYQAWTAAVLAAQDLFTAAPPSRERPTGWPPTRYEHKALAAGRQPLYWSLLKPPAAVTRAAPGRGPP